MIGRCAPEGKNLFPSVVIVSLIWFFYFFSVVVVVVVREDWRSGRCDPSTDFWTRNSALIQSVVVVVAAVFFIICLG